MKLKQLANILGLVLLIALVVPFLIYAVPSVIGAEYSFIVLSGSMEPSISPGDAVIVSETPTESIVEGDTITFTRGDQETPVTHRVVGIDSTAGGLTFETKGDNNAEVDSSPVPASNVLGVVVLTIPYIGYVVQAANSPVGFIFLVVAPIGLFVLSELWTLLRSRGGGTEPVPGETANATAESPAGGEFSVSPNELGIGLAVLAVSAPYSIYVAFQLQNALSVSVAFGMSISLISVALLWLSGRSGSKTDAPTDSEDASVYDAALELDPATDGGRSTEDAK